MSKEVPWPLTVWYDMLEIDLLEWFKTRNLVEEKQIRAQKRE